jgi:hypothetical protein
MPNLGILAQNQSDLVANVVSAAQAFAQDSRLPPRKPDADIPWTQLPATLALTCSPPTHVAQVPEQLPPRLHDLVASKASDVPESKVVPPCGHWASMALALACPLNAPIQHN